jgi:hypothetical protein
LLSRSWWREVQRRSVSARRPRSARSSPVPARNHPSHSADLGAPQRVGGGGLRPHEGREVQSPIGQIGVEASEGAHRFGAQQPVANRGLTRCGHLCVGVSELQTAVSRLAGALSGFLREYALPKDAGAHVEQLVGHCISEHGPDRVIDVMDGPRRELAVSTKLEHQIADVPGPHRREQHVPELREHVAAEPNPVIARAHQPQRGPLVEPLATVDGQGKRSGRAAAGRRGHLARCLRARLEAPKESLRLRLVARSVRGRRVPPIAGLILVTDPQLALLL